MPVKELFAPLAGVMFHTMPHKALFACFLWQSYTYVLEVVKYLTSQGIGSTGLGSPVEDRAKTDACQYQTYVSCSI